MAPKAGISLGWIFDTVPDTLCNILRFLRQNNADAVELCLDPVRLRHLVLFWNQELAASLAPFDYVSLHLPEITCRKNDSLTDEVAQQIVSLLSVFNVYALVVHPDTIEDWDSLARYNENAFNGKIAVEFPMDKDKKSGRAIEELIEIYDNFPDFSFVLDVQHAYENDPIGNLAIEAAEIMDSRLQHLHVSGQKQRQKELSRHSFLYEADNRDKIQRVLTLLPFSDIPRISEGEFKTCDATAVVSELNCLRLVSPIKIIEESIEQLEQELSLAQGRHMAKMDIGTVDEEREAQHQVSQLEAKIANLRQQLKE